MEIINGCIVISRSESPDPIHFGQPEAGGAYVAIIGVFQPGEPAPRFTFTRARTRGLYRERPSDFRLGDPEVTVTAGGFVFVPRGTPHTVWNSGVDAVRGLLLISPDDAEHEFIPADSSAQEP